MKETNYIFKIILRELYRYKNNQGVPCWTKQNPVLILNRVFKYMKIVERIINDNFRNSIQYFYIHLFNYMIITLNMYNL